ncbi:MAG: RdgB/HAM1 family non-canonical purine NTP pyrophosphatase [Halobacteriovoraceae bacterium]|nr:RdgB/HAM1 family non-canonical purine NTP pyrophosphatase [Halobacteriovoraceae bacterium]
MKFFLASSNSHKAKEFDDLYSDSVVEIESISEKIHVEETGTTFNQNALLKAQAYYDKFKRPIMSDDSGLVVDALPNELGIYSARFGGEGYDDEGRARLLLKKMEGVPDSKRSAYFLCVLCFYINPQEIFFFEGRVNGKIALDYIGEEGFGYDPVFIPDLGPEDKTLAQLPNWKLIHSHRAVAVSKSIQFFQSIS